MSSGHQTASTQITQLSTVRFTAEEKPAATLLIRSLVSGMGSSSNYPTWGRADQHTQSQTAKITSNGTIRDEERPPQHKPSSLSNIHPKMKQIIHFYQLKAFLVVRGAKIIKQNRWNGGGGRWRDFLWIMQRDSNYNYCISFIRLKLCPLISPYQNYFTWKVFLCFFDNLSKDL